MQRSFDVELRRRGRADVAGGALRVDRRRCTGKSAWTCFRADFHADHRYSCDFAELAAFWHDQQRLLQRWRERSRDRMVTTSMPTRWRRDRMPKSRALFAHVGLDADARIDCDRLSRARTRADARAYGDLVKPLAGMLDACAGARTPRA